MVRLLVAAMALLSLFFAWLCHVGPSWHPLLVLLVYIPLPLLSLPAALAVLVSLWLSWWWRAVALGSLALVLTVVMGLVWGAPDEGVGRVRLMTYNVKAYLAMQRAGGPQALAAEFAAHDADVIVLQDSAELEPMQDDERAPLWNLMFGKREIFYRGQYMIASRYPLRDCRVGLLQGQVVDKAHSYLHCQVQVGQRAFDLVTVHLVTPRQGLVAVRREGLDGLDQWRQNLSYRTEQAVALVNQLRGRTRPLVLAGDLNAPERTEVLRILMGQLGLRDAFSSAGFGYGYTHGHSLRLGLSFLRIDHILVSDDIGVAAVEVGGAEGSEHRPVIADLLLQRTY